MTLGTYRKVSKKAITKILQDKIRQKKKKYNKHDVPYYGMIFTTS